MTLQRKVCLRAMTQWPLGRASFCCLTASFTPIPSCWRSVPVLSTSPAQQWEHICNRMPRTATWVGRTMESGPTRSSSDRYHFLFHHFVEVCSDNQGVKVGFDRWGEPETQGHYILQNKISSCCFCHYGSFPAPGFYKAGIWQLLLNSIIIFNSNTWHLLQASYVNYKLFGKSIWALILAIILKHFL